MSNRQASQSRRGQEHKPRRRRVWRESQRCSMSARLVPHTVVDGVRGEDDAAKKTALPATRDRITYLALRHDLSRKQPMYKHTTKFTTR